jgi:hypothetical protein
MWLRPGRKSSPKGDDLGAAGAKPGAIIGARDGGRALCPQPLPRQAGWFGILSDQISMR